MVELTSPSMCARSASMLATVFPKQGQRASYRPRFVRDTVGFGEVAHQFEFAARYSPGPQRPDFGARSSMIRTKPSMSRSHLDRPPWRALPAGTASSFAASRPSGSMSSTRRSPLALGAAPLPRQRTSRIRSSALSRLPHHGSTESLLGIRRSPNNDRQMGTAIECRSRLKRVPSQGKNTLKKYFFRQALGITGFSCRFWFGGETGEKHSESVP